jgi:hypothetical protein
MATEVLELSVKTNIGQSITSLKELKEAIKAAKDEQIAMANKFGATSQEAINASKNLAELKNKVDSLNNASKSLKGSGFEMLKQGFGQIREGLMNLDFDKVKTGLIGMGSGFTSMGQQAKAAFTGIKGAIAATGIGLLVIALGTIYAYWDDIKGVVSGLTTEQKRLNAEAEKNVKIAQDNLDIISQQENILKLQGKTEKEILNMKIAATDEAIKHSIIDLKRAQASKQAQIDSAKRNREILEGAIVFVSKPLMLLLEGIDAVGKAFKKDFGLAEGFTDTIANLIVDPVKVEADLNGAITAQEKALLKLQNDRAGHEIRIDDIGKEGNEKRKAAQKAFDDARIQAAKDLEAELKAIRDEAANQLILDEAALLDSFAESQLTEQQREQNAIYDKYFAIIQAKKQNGEDILELETNLASEIAAVQEKYGKESADKEKDRKKALQSFNVGMAQQGLQVIADAAGEGTALAKAAAIAQATISGVQGVQNAFTSANANIPATAASFGAYPVTMAALAGVFAAANIAKIASGGGGGVTPPSTPPPSTTTPAPQMMSGAFQLGGGVKPEPMKAFVVTDEMSNSQSQLANIRRRATI